MCLVTSRNQKNFSINENESCHLFYFPMTEDSYTRPYRRRFGKLGMNFPYKHVGEKHDRPLSWIPSRDFLKEFDKGNSDVESDTIKEPTFKCSSKSPSLLHNELLNGQGKLAQEIQDELLICKICLGNYKQPKSLSCLHTFCAECLDNHIQGEVTYKKYSDYRDLTCPLCRKRTSLPVGGVRKLPDNFVVASLFDMIQKRKSSISELTDDEESKVSLSCQICQKLGNKKKEAQTKCIDCCKLMCKSCTDMHKQTKVTKLHSLFDLNIEEEVICKVHNDESVRFFCEPCQTCICVLCTFNEHMDHEVTQFTDAVIKYKTEIENEQSKCRNIILNFEDKLSKISKVEEIIKTTEDQISTLAVKLMSEIKHKEKNLLEEIRNMYGENLFIVLESKSILELQLADLRNTCNMTDMVLQRKDVELLLLKKEIQEKLSEMNYLPDIELPPTISKKVKFISGIMDFGCIQDMDRPLLTKPKNYKEFMENIELLPTEMISAETQTDPSITKPSTLSKSVSTIPIQIANKAVNTRSRIVQQKTRAASVQLVNGSLSSVDVQPITSSEPRVALQNNDKVSLVSRTYNSTQIKRLDTKDLIMSASDILSEYISNTNLGSEQNVDTENGSEKCGL